MDSDGLSTLPDGILLLILSFLPDKESVRTSILSKRFKTLYASLPDLNFDYNLFNNRNKDFYRFMYRVIDLRDDSLKVNRLIISSDSEVRARALAKVLGYAVSHRVQHIDIKGIMRCYPKCIYSPKLESLITLKLGTLGCLKKKICFRQLVSLSLTGFKILVTDFFSSCPFLEDLTLTRCSFKCDPATGLHICAPRLSRLRMWSLRATVQGNYKLLFSTPKLRYFLLGYRMIDLSTGAEGLPLLQTVELHVRAKYVQIQDIKFQHLLTGLLLQLRHAKSLVLSYSTVQTLAVKPDLLEQKPSPFETLQHLHFCWYAWEERFEVPDYVITYLLKKSPNAAISYGTTQVKTFKDCIHYSQLLA